MSKIGYYRGMKDNRLIGINGLFLRKPGTGIGQVTKYFLETLAQETGSDFEYRVYTDEDQLSVPLGGRGVIVYIKPWWKRDDLIRKILWEHIQLPKKALADGVTNFLSLYQAPTEFPKALRHVMVVHDLIPEIFPNYIPNSRTRMLWNLTKRALRKTSALVAVSQSTKRDVEKYLAVAGNKIEVIYPSVNPIFFEEANNAHDQENVLEKYQLSPGYLYHGGGLEVRKNTESLLTAYASWRASTQDKSSVPKLVISGTLHDKSNRLATDVEGLVKTLQLEGSVRLLGFVPDVDLPSLYRGATLFVYPSLYEGFGMPVLEALSQGTAVLATRHSSLGEVGGESVYWTANFTKETLEMNYQKAVQSSVEEKNVRILQAKNFKSWFTFSKALVDILIQ